MLSIKIWHSGGNYYKHTDATMFRMIVTVGGFFAIRQEWLLGYLKNQIISFTKKAI